MDMAMIVTVLQDVTQYHVVHTNIMEQCVSSVREPVLHGITANKTLIVMTVILPFYSVNKIFYIHICQEAGLLSPCCLLYTSA